jgi:hypothetical protein
MKLLTGIDAAMPDIKKRWSYHAEWNQHQEYWREDFRQLADYGFKFLRWGLPWSMVETGADVYRWELLDERVELASRLGIATYYPVMHFNVPTWVVRQGEPHGILSERLSDRLALYTARLVERYRFKWVTPIVEVQMDAFQRGFLGRWQPHLKGRANHDRIYRNLVKAFIASAAAAREGGAEVIANEPASAVDTIVDFGGSVDVAGIDHYPHMHRRSLGSYLRQWWSRTRLPLAITEFDIPETYDPITGADHPRLCVSAGIDTNRVIVANELYATVAELLADGIPIKYGGWYPATGNIGWGAALTRRRDNYDCDRAGLIDLERQVDGSLKRVPCENLIRAVLKLRDLDPVFTHDAVEAAV